MKNIEINEIILRQDINSEEKLNLLYSKHYKSLFDRISIKISNKVSDNITQECLICLWKSVEKFDSSKNTKFTTYFNSRLRNILKNLSSTEFYNNGRLSRSLSERLYNYNNLTDIELAKLENKKAIKYNMLNDFAKCLTFSEIEKNSINNGIDNYEFEIEDKDKDISDILIILKDLLSEKELDIISMTYQGYSKKEIGFKYNITPQYVGILLNKIENKIKKEMEL